MVGTKVHQRARCAADHVLGCVGEVPTAYHGMDAFDLGDLLRKLHRVDDSDVLARRDHDKTRSRPT
jgi:hypothetical protein